ncbi:MAG TPA: protein kinase, partial [bacterium]|nr:protein kinase [bacterium]
MSEPVVFGRYLLLERIAAGGMAEVFKAKSYGVAGFEKLLVIKKILPHLSQNERFVSMFIKEAKIAVNLNHKNVVQVFDLGKVADDYYIAMEYVHGKDLREITRACAKKRIPLPLSLACYLLAEIAAGLDYAHRRKDLEDNPLNIIHMDISPQNVLVSYEGDVKIADFGIAHAVGGDGKMKGGVLRGKYAYMSPEMALGKPVDQRTDIFSAGVILHELITGRRLFYESDEVRTIENVRKCNVPLPSSINPQVPPKLESVTMKALSADPDKRYQTAEELRADLTEVLFGFSRVVDAGDLARFFRKVFAKEAQPAPGVSDLANLISDLSRLGARPTVAPGAVPRDGVEVPPSAKSVVPTVEKRHEDEAADETLNSVDEAAMAAPPPKAPSQPPIVRGKIDVPRERTENDVSVRAKPVAVAEVSKASEGGAPAVPASALEQEEVEGYDTSTGTGARYNADGGSAVGMVPDAGEATESSAIPLEDEILQQGMLPMRRPGARAGRREPTVSRGDRAGFDYTMHAGATPAPEISITGERKRVAILAVRFFEGNRPVRPNDLRVAEVGAIVKRFGGTPVAPRADVMLAYFGVPAAQEDDLERAIGAAREVSRSERRAAARGGRERALGLAIHSGTVAVETPPARPATLGPPMVSGAPILVAERLARSAAPAQIVASRSVTRIANRRHEFVRIDPDVDKETGMTLERHELSERAGAAVGDLIPLIGRTREVGILTGVLAKIQRGHGQVLAIVGEAGSGKSRLVAELAAVVRDKELGYFSARGAPFGAEGDYALIGELIASIVGFSPDDSLDDKRDKLMRLHELGLEKHEVHFVGELAGVRFDGSGIDAFDAQTRRLGMFAALRKAVERL